MKATAMDLKRRTKEIIEALERNETVTIYYRGKKKGVIHPVGKRRNSKVPPMMEHPAVGMWADREDMADPVEWVNNLRKSRFDVD